MFGCEIYWAKHMLGFNLRGVNPAWAGWFRVFSDAFATFAGGHSHCVLTLAVSANFARSSGPIFKGGWTAAEPLARDLCACSPGSPRPFLKWSVRNDRFWPVTAVCVIVLCCSPPANTMAPWLQDSHFGYDVEGFWAARRVKCWNICSLCNIKFVGQLELFALMRICQRITAEPTFELHSLEGIELNMPKFASQCSK